MRIQDSIPNHILRKTTPTEKTETPFTKLPTTIFTQPLPISFIKTISYNILGMALKTSHGAHLLYPKGVPPNFHSHVYPK